MFKFSSKDKKKSEKDKTIAIKSTTSEQGSIVHSTSLTSCTVQRVTETRTTTIHQFGSSSSFPSQNSLNSFTGTVNNLTGSSSSLQKYTNKDLNLKPQFLTSISTDAVPFTRSGVYKSTPYRSAFTSTPLTTSSSGNTINLNYKSPFANQRTRSTSIASPITNTNSNPTSRLPNQTTGISSQLNNSDNPDAKLVVKVKKSIKFYNDPQAKVRSYPTRSKHRGRLLLINNIKFANDKQQVRIGAELDEENLVQLFTQMKFEIVKHRNLNKKQMESKIKNFRSDSSLKKFDIATVIVMSHGTGKENSGSTQVVCTDEQLLETSWIINQFDGSLCPHLLGKPKIFIFQCCRGDNRQIVQHDSVPFSVPRKLSDMLMAYSTVPGFVSHRNPKTGTWYIQKVCQVFMDHSHDTDVENLLKIVDYELSTLVSDTGSKQTSSFENWGFKTCFLHPQLHE